MAAPGAGIAIGIDFGQLTTGLSAIMGIGRGLAHQKTLDNAVLQMARTAEKGFGAYADQAGAAGTIAHVYEYGQEGQPGGRLWDIKWSHGTKGSTGNVFFKRAEIPTSEAAGIDPRLVASARAAGRTLAGHFFPEKASHLEDTKTLISEAGKQEHTTRVGGDNPNPRALVYIDASGEVRFAKRRRRENEFYQKFHAVFASYWVGSVQSKMEPKVRRAFVETATYGAGVANKSIRAAAGASIPRIPPGMSGVFATDRGRPYAGVRLRQADITRVEESVKKRLLRELSR